MPIKEAGVRFAPELASCLACGHSALRGSARLRGSECLWVSYCPACGTVHERATIPAAFGFGPIQSRVTH